MFPPLLPLLPFLFFLSFPSKPPQSPSCSKNSPASHPESPFLLKTYFSSSLSLQDPVSSLASLNLLSPPHQSTSLAKKNPSGKSAPVVLFTTSASVESQPPPWLQSPASPRAPCSCSSKKPGPSFKRLSPHVSQVAGKLTMNTYMYIDI